MKNTTFKKKALISSIAMLLVALVALGSATFAWFAANPNASATGLKLNTTASTGLVIRTETDQTWSHEAAIDKDGAIRNLTPVSMLQDGTGTFYTVDADAAAAYGTSKTPETTTAGFYKENVYCRLSDGSDVTGSAAKKVYLKGVTITKSDNNPTMDGCIRVAITCGDSLLGTWTTSTGTANGVLTPDAGSFAPTLAAASTSLNVDTGLTELSATESDLSKYITVYVYLDGQDTNCFSDKVGKVNAEQIIKSVKVDLALA